MSDQIDFELHDSKKGTKLGMVALHIFTLLTFLPWYAVFDLSFMSYDAGYSLQATVFVVLLGLYPIVSIVLSILAWIKLKKGLKKKAILLSATPLLLTIAFIAFLAFVTKI